MWSYFKLLFSKNYWALVRRRQFWRDSWVAMRRAHKDKRARKQMRLLLTVLATPLICLFFAGLLFFSAGALAWGRPELGIGFLAGSVIALVRGRGRGRGAEAETLKLFEPEKVAEWLISAELRKRIAELALVYAVMADRAGSEGFLAVKALPEGFEIATRRVHVTALREYGLSDRLGVEERDLLLLPDGHWQPEVAKRVSLYTLDQVRVLRWVLRLDEFLPVVGSTLEQDYALAKQVVLEPKRLFDGIEVVTRSSLEVARDAANQYFQRCAAEGVKREYFEPENEKNLAWSRRYSDRMAGRQSEDLLLGRRIVSEADEGVVRLATVLALRRYRLCAWLVGVLAGELVMGDDLKVM